MITGTSIRLGDRGERRPQRHARHVDGDRQLSATDVDSSATFVAQTMLATSYGTSRSMRPATGATRSTTATRAVQALNTGGTLHDLHHGDDRGRHEPADRHHDQRRQRRGGDHRHVDPARSPRRAAFANGTPGVSTATGTLTATDVDSAATFDLQSNAGPATAPSRSMRLATGATRSTTATRRPGAEHRRHAARLITVTTADGTSHQIDITINGANDAAVITGLIPAR